VLLKQAPQKRPEINIIPMVDIVFQLIIFFLVATQVKKQEITGLQLPIAKTPEEIKKDETPPLIINIVRPEIDKARPYIVMGNRFDLEGLKRFLRNRKKSLELTDGTMPILRIRADRDSQFKEVQNALIACRDIEIWKIRLSAIKKKD